MKIRDKLAGFKFFQATKLNANVDARNWRKIVFVVAC